MAASALTSAEALIAQAPGPGFGVCEIDVAVLLAEGLEVIFDPREKEGPAHVQVRGALTASVRKRLSARAQVVIPPNIPEAGPE